MTDIMRRRGGRRPATPGPEDAWLVDVAEGASRDAGGVPVELLGDVGTVRLHMACLHASGYMVTEWLDSQGGA